MRIQILAWMAASSTLSFLTVASTAQAGFEFSANASSAAPAATSVYGEAPMPIVPTPNVDAMPLAANPVPASPYSAAQYEPRLQQEVPAPLQDESSKLLNADAHVNYIGLVPGNNAPAAPVSGLVINPYPLQAGVQAVPTTQWGSERMGKMVVGKPAPKTQVMFSDNTSPYGGLTPVPGGEPGPIPMTINPYPLNKAPGKTVESAPTGTYTDIVGFGRDLPLALALSQVVPASYSYAFAQSIDTGAIVSWEGGKPWNVVLKEMLARAGLKAEIQENRVLVTKA
jgi:hypothetical protein